MNAKRSKHGRFRLLREEKIAANSYEDCTFVGIIAGNGTFALLFISIALLLSPTTGLLLFGCVCRRIYERGL